MDGWKGTVHSTGSPFCSAEQNIAHAMAITLSSLTLEDYPTLSAHPSLAADRQRDSSPGTHSSLRSAPTSRHALDRAQKVNIISKFSNKERNPDQMNRLENGKETRKELVDTRGLSFPLSSQRKPLESDLLDDKAFQKTKRTEAGRRKITMMMT